MKSPKAEAGRRHVMPPAARGPPDLYRTLQVPPDASIAQIRKAYRALARKYHPDKQPLRKQKAATRRLADIVRPRLHRPSPVPRVTS